MHPKDTDQMANSVDPDVRPVSFLLNIIFKDITEVLGTISILKLFGHCFNHTLGRLIKHINIGDKSLCYTACHYT